MNLPLDEIHDCLHGFGCLLVPLPMFKDKYVKWRWIGVFKYKLHITDKYGFHNCTSTEVY